MAAARSHPAPAPSGISTLPRPQRPRGARGSPPPTSAKDQAPATTPRACAPESTHEAGQRSTTSPPTDRAPPNMREGALYIPVAFPRALLPSTPTDGPADLSDLGTRGPTDLRTYGPTDLSSPRLIEH